MYGPGKMGYIGGRRGIVPFGGSLPPALVVIGLVVVGLFFFSMAGPFFHFFPFIFFFGWMIPFLLVPALGLSARGIAGLLEARSRRPVDNDRKERELLEALARYGEISPARVALETTLSVSEADRMLSELAKNGHIEVRAHEGTLGYALWEHDRRELTG
ncbi:MAG: hypothetical protein QOI57_2205 [Rubrobacteraceae bacterium]|jgi:hypothetical protein|nr:hypothetical protein [Rubrobacteraceae bacterium]